MPDDINEVDVIKLGEKEYSQDDLQELVGLGELAREAEEKYSTKIDKVWPDYGRTKNQVKQLEQELEALQREKEEQAAAANQPVQDVTVRDAQEAARKLGIVLQDDFDKHLEGGFRQYYMRERQAEKILENIESLEDKIDGSDGRPAFDKVEVLEYMKQTGIQDPMAAYELKYKDETDNWRAEQLIKSKKGGFTTIQPGGEKEPKSPKVTDGNLSDMLREVLSQ